MSELRQESATADREVVVSRLVDAPQNLVFEVFTDVRHLSRWWGPDGFHHHHAILRVPGRWSVGLHDARARRDGVLRVDLVDRHRTTGADRAAARRVRRRSERVRVVLTFTAEGTATRVELRTLFPTRELRDEAVEKYHAVEGGQQTLGKLAAYVTSLGAEGR